MGEKLNLKSENDSLSCSLQRARQEGGRCAKCIAYHGFVNTKGQKNWDPEGKQARNKKQENMRRSDVGGSRGHVTRVRSR